MAPPGVSASTFRLVVTISTCITVVTTSIPVNTKTHTPPAVASSALPANKPQHVVFIVADDLGIGDVGAFNRARASDTPNIDRLAVKGLKLTRFRVNSPCCAPSRAAFITGFEPAAAGYSTSQACGLAGDGSEIASGRLNSTWITIPKAMRRAGYYTVHLGTWGLGGDNAPPPRAYGFDRAVIFSAQEEGLRFWPSYAQYPELKFRDKHALNELLIDDARIVAESAESVYISVNPSLPRAPLSPRREHMEAVGPKKCDLDAFYGKGFSFTRPPMPLRISSVACAERVYRASVYSFDRLVGTVHDLFASPNTLTIVTSDNGPELPVNGINSMRWTQRGVGMARGAKCSLYDGGLRVPFIMHWPSQILPAVSRIDAVAIDLLPTLASVTGIALKKDIRRKGRNIFASLNAERKQYRRPKGRLLFWESDYSKPGPCLAVSPRFAVMARDHPFKLLVEPAHKPYDRAELYNTSHSEKINLYGVVPSKDMERGLADWYQEARSTFPADGSSPKKCTPIFPHKESPTYECKVPRHRIGWPKRRVSTERRVLLGLFSPDKTGTTAIFSDLAAMPQISPAACKEVRFFDADEVFDETHCSAMDTPRAWGSERPGSKLAEPWTKWVQAPSGMPATDAYRAIINGAGNEPIAIECVHCCALSCPRALCAYRSTPSYFQHFSAPTRMANFFRGHRVKLLFALRDPVRRFLSRLLGHQEHLSLPREQLTCEAFLNDHIELVARCNRSAPLCGMTFNDTCAVAENNDVVTHSPVGVGAYIAHLEFQWAGAGFDITGELPAVLVFFSVDNLCAPRRGWDCACAAERIFYVRANGLTSIPSNRNLAWRCME